MHEDAIIKWWTCNVLKELFVLFLLNNINAHIKWVLTISNSLMQTETAKEQREY